MRSAPPGCLSLLVFGVILLLPFVLANVVFAALAKLGLGATSSLVAASGIFLGSAVNIPVTRIDHETAVTYAPRQLLGLGRLLSRPIQQRTYTVIAVNLGGCLVPIALAGYQIARIVRDAPSVLPAAGVAIAINVAVCYYFAEPVPETGIAMPALLPAIAAAICGLALAPEWAPPVAFAAGVLGPIIGADFLHLDDIAEIGTGMASIGGAGTFDGIVLSSLLATLLVPGAL